MMNTTTTAPEMHDGLPVLLPNAPFEKHPALGPRPAPSDIRFGADLFETVGYKRQWSVCMVAPRYPERFTSEEECAKFCRRVGCSVPAPDFVPVQRRVRWS